jgi:hypothetical protein
MSDTAPQPGTFGVPTFNSDVGFALAVSDDKEAFTASFSGLSISLDPSSSAPVTSRVFTFVLPLSGADPNTEIPFFVSGFIASESGANGHMLFSINDQTTVADFSGALEQDFLQQLKFKPGSASEVRLTVFLLADRDSKSNASVTMNVLAIDTDTAKHGSAQVPSGAPSSRQR